MHSTLRLSQEFTSVANGKHIAPYAACHLHTGGGSQTDWGERPEISNCFNPSCMRHSAQCSINFNSLITYSSYAQAR